MYYTRAHFQVLRAHNEKCRIVCTAHGYIIHRALFITHRALFIIHRALFIIHTALFIIHTALSYRMCYVKETLCTTRGLIVHAHDEKCRIVRKALCYIIHSALFIIIGLSS